MALRLAEGEEGAMCDGLVQKYSFERKKKFIVCGVIYYEKTKAKR
jgi:hypothetical protein